MIENKIHIAIDAMGGDHGPSVTILGIARFIKQNPNANVRFLVYGQQEKVIPCIEKNPILKENDYITFVHTDDIITNDMKPADAIRKGRQSSMRMAINAVKSNEANACISSGNTGALMAMSKFVLNTIPGVSRPAIVTNYPTQTSGKIVTMLDLGANSSCTSDQLVEFALMGSAFFSAFDDSHSPRVGILNIGSEDMKGNEVVKDAARYLSEHPNLVNYHGFIEGDELFTNKVDVVVTDGFTGNVALKTIEGTAKFIARELKQAIKSSWIAKIAVAVFLLPILLKLKRKLDPREYNGAMMVGLNGICIKSHGSSDAKSFSKAIGVAYQLVKKDINNKIDSKLSEIV